MNDVKKLADLTMLDPKRCVLCIIPGCYMADLCGTTEGKKYRVAFCPTNTKVKPNKELGS